MSAPTLLDPAFVRELEALGRRLQIRARSGGAGERASRRRGSSAEFLEHRAYVQGDDPRRVDWAATARLGQPVLKTFRAEEDAVVRIFIDASGSLDFGTPRKAEVAQRLGAAVGWLALHGSQRAQVLVGHDSPAVSPQASRPAPGTASATGATGFGTTMHPTRRGRAGIPALLRDLGALEARGTLDMARALDRVVQQARRPGWLVVISDFFDPGPLVAALTRARSAGHDVSLVQILAEEELEPELEGDLGLVDAETGRVVELTVDPTTLLAYARRLAGLVEALAGFARKHGAGYVRVKNTDPLEDAVRRLVARSIDP